MIEILRIILEVLIILVLVFLNGFFVAAEFSLVKIRASQLRPMEKNGGVKVASAIKATKHLDEVLSSTQLGITLASLGLGWVGEPFIAHRIGPILNFFGITNSATISSISFALAFAIITFMHIVFGELAPKSIAIQYPKKTSLNVAFPLVIFHKLFFPAIWALNGTAAFFLRRVGIHPAGEGSHSFSAEELEYVLSHDRGTNQEQTLVNRLMIRSLRFRETRANEIMIPRDEINAIMLEQSPQENLKVAQTTAHSRYPVFNHDLDHPVGILLTREWLWQIHILGENTPIKPLLREVQTFPPDALISDVLESFRQSQNHIALIVNDEGRTLGLVSIEDILEEIVGDIRDEFDTEKREIFCQTQDFIDVAGTLNMHELEAETGWNFEWDGNSYETVTNWVKSLKPGARIRRGETLRTDELEITPLEIVAGSFKRIRIRRIWEEKSDPA